MKIFGMLPHICTLLLLIACPGGSAWGRALLVESVPRNGAVLVRTPGNILLRFDSEIQPNRTTFNFSEVGGRFVPGLPAQRRPSGPTDRLTVALPVIGRGSYILRYKVVDLHGESSNGSVSFTAGGY